tara:strand:+ start:113 stop:511 length:399 start_codon:yes stop_codon:yes gene_type:complete
VTKDSQSKNQQPNNPLHGLTLEAVVTQLVESYGFPYLAERVKINCFKSDPSIKSSLKFLRRTLWAREQVEKLYVAKFSKAGHPPQYNPGLTKSKPKADSSQLKLTPQPKPESTPAKPVSPPNPWASGAYKKS